ncbi:MAG: T9SS type A sorting domain-containing protein [Saprospiraceae bacterium]
MKQLSPLGIRLLTLSLFLFSTPIFLQANTGTPPYGPAFTCDPPVQVSLQLLTSSYVDISWSYTGTDPVDSYEWEVGFIDFDPGTGTSYLNGTTPDTFVSVLGITGLAGLDFYVKTNCPGGSSTWSGPIRFFVPPGCGDAFTDSGGALNDYSSDELDTTIICPTPGLGLVSTVSFLSFETEENQDFLKIYDGISLDAPQLANLTGYYAPADLPGPFTATNTTGCLTFVFQSNGQVEEEGWTAGVLCAPPAYCLEPMALNITELASDSVSLAWDGVAGNTGYEWQIGPSPFQAGDTPEQSGMTTDESLTIQNLSGNTDYTFIIRSVCGPGDESVWVEVNFHTQTSCGDNWYDSGGIAGDYSDNEDYTELICPNAVGEVVYMDFPSFKTQNGDVLYIHDGTDINAPLIGSFEGTISSFPTIEATNGTGCLTLHFVSDAMNTKEGWEATVSCAAPSGCGSPLGLQLTALSSDQASVDWIDILAATGFNWELGEAPYAPGGTSLQSGSTTDSELALTGLMSSTDYQLYVQTVCAGGNSIWLGISFTTPPGCGDDFYDTGGSADNYQNNEDYTTTICPNDPGDVVSLIFASFKSDQGDVLSLYHGTEVDPAFFIGSLEGNVQNPGVFTSGVSNGCITAHFTSDASSTQAGWFAGVVCAPPNNCIDPIGVTLVEATPDGAVISWAGLAGTTQYEWQVVPAGVNPFPSGTTTTDTFVTVTGLLSISPYDFYVRANCGPNGTSGWVKLSFTTAINCFPSGGNLVCGNTRLAVIGAGNGAWELNCTSPPFPTYGRELVFTFTAPVTRTYLLDVAASGSNGLATYFYKEASLGCDADNWECIGDFNTAGGTEAFGPLIAGKTYFILVDNNSPFSSAVQTFKIVGCGPVNDEAAGAIELTLNTPCAGNIHSNLGAGYLLGEPDPDTSSVDGLAGRWLDPAEKTVWFKFQAPFSGSITLTSDSYPQGSNFDTQIALYEASDPFDYATFVYIESDEDNGVINNGFNAVLYYTGLYPGQTYYVQVDGYGVSEGTFCLELLDGIERVEQEDCFDTYTILDVDGTQPGGERWYGIYTNPDILDLGQMVAAINPGFQDIGDVSCKIAVSDNTIELASNGVPYMPAYVQFSSTVEPTLPVQIRLFFYDYELNALKLATGMLSNTVSDLVVTRYNGIVEDCTPANNNTIPSSVGTVQLITSIDEFITPGTHSFFLEFYSDTLGEYGAHFGTAPLPLELLRFSGKALDAYNLIEWTTSNEVQLEKFVLERSYDGLQWESLESQPALGNNSSQQTNYQQLDKEVKGSAYYRLKSVDFDGTHAYSNILYIQRSGGALVLQTVYPNPTSNLTKIRFNSQDETPTDLLIYNLTGRLVLKKRLLPIIGSNELELDLSQLPAGMYSLRLQTERQQSESLKVIKN